MGQFVTKKGTPARRQAAGGSTWDPDMIFGLPALFEYLTEGVWEDGTERETATLLFFLEDNMVKCCLNDRAEGRTLWASAISFPDALRRLEEQLAGGSPDWRQSKGKGRR